MRSQPRALGRSVLLYLALPLAVGAAACKGDPEVDYVPSDAAPNVIPDVGVDLTSAPNPGVGGQLTMPADDKCIGSSIAAEEAQALCQWGAGVLGPEGTVFRAACMDIVRDAGAPAPDRELSMVDMIVLSQSNCISRVRTDYSTDCPYLVRQFKLSVEAFHVGNCGAGPSLSSLVGYK